jgi:ketosteroid isomerase-like protein
MLVVEERPERSMIRPLLAVMLALSLALPAAAAKKKPPAPPPVTPATVVAAERAFAADGLAMGIKQSFLKHMADDAVVFQPEPVNARQAISAQSDKPGPKLEWWPIWAGIAASGDLGFTTGPYAVEGVRRGHYFTVWKKQADGSWKWLYDGGPNSSAKDAPGPGSTPGFLMVSKFSAGDEATAFASAQAADAALNAAAAEDVPAAFMAALVCEARVQGSTAAPAQGCSSFRDELASRPRKIVFTPLGGSASSGGDLAWTYGEAEGSNAGKAFRGHYVRVWQFRGDAWRLVFDQILPAPPKAPAKKKG